MILERCVRLGWKPVQESARARIEARGLEPARVVRIDRGAYHLWAPTVAREEDDSFDPGKRVDLGEPADAGNPFASPEHPAKLLGRLARAPRHERPAVGDWVAVRPGTATAAPVIEAVLPRFSAFTRQVAGARSDVQVVAANVDTVFLVLGLDRDFNVRRLERMTVLAHDSGARPVAILTKADLLPGGPDLAARVAEAQAVHPGLPVHPIAARTGEGLAALDAYLTPGETLAVLGSSGVGKSTLINALLGEDRMATGAVRGGDDRGRHTTTHRELVKLPGGALFIDTPGMRELGLVGDEAALDDTFEDVAALVAACRFGDCGHTNEPDCRVREALAAGALDPARWAAYQTLQEELTVANRRHGEGQARLSPRRRRGPAGRSRRRR